MKEAELQEALAKAVEKGTEEAKSQVAELVKELGEAQSEIKALAEAQAKSLSTTPEKKESGMKKAGKLFKAMALNDVLEMKTLSEGVDANGGYLVHAEFVSGVFRAVEDFGLGRKYCTKYNMNSKDLEVTTLATNVSTSWTDEGASITASNPTFGRVTITAKKLASLVEMTSELQEDADHNVAETVAKLIAEEFARAEDTQVLTGDGTVFTGVLSDTNVNVVTMATGDTAFVNVSSDYLIDLTRAVAVKYKSNYAPRFYLSQDIIAHIEKLKDSEGQPLYRTLNEAGKATLLGYPVELTDVMPAAADDAASTKFIAFGDLKFVGLGVRKNVTAEVGHIDGGFQADKKSLKVIERVGVAMLIGEAFSVLKTAAS